MVQRLIHFLQSPKKLKYRRKISKNSYFISIITGLLIGIGLSILFHYRVFEKLEAISIDLRFKIRQNPPLSDKLAIVGITKDCIDQIGDYPIPREVYAKTIQYVSKAGASSICFDIFFDLPGVNKSSDEHLANAFNKANNVTLPIFTPYRLDPLAITNNVFVTYAIRENLEVFTKSTKRQGHINAIPDPDGKIRRIPMILQYNSRYIYPMALEAFLHNKKIDKKEISIEKHGIKVSQEKIPLDEEQSLIVNYFNPESAIDFTHLEIPGADIASNINFFYFKDVYTGRIPERFFKDKIVLIGQTCHGLANSDECITPFGIMFGIFIQASVINSLLTNNFVQRMDSTLSIFLIIAISFFLSVLLSKMNFFKALLMSLFAMGICVFCSAFLFVSKGLVIETIPLFMTVLLNFFVHLAKKFHDALELVFKKEKELGIINKASARILDLYEVSDTPNMIIQNIFESIPVEGCLLYIRNQGENDKKMILKAERFYGSAHQRLKRAISSIMDEITTQITKTKGPLLFDDSNIGNYPQLSQYAVKSLFIVPLVIHREIIGILFLCNKRSFNAQNIEFFTNEDLKLLNSLLSQSAVSLENFLLYNNMHELFMCTIKSLVASIDAKDPYTAGHSERVTEIAELIGIEIGLPPNLQENLKISAILHDVGKIGIAEKILCSTQRLTDEEFEVIKSHPKKGEEILCHIQEFNNVIPGVKHHHERYDGKGYPKGLKGEEIPLTARIIAIADTFDAITSNRTYRNKRSVDFAIGEIRRCSGTQFDPSLTEAFLKCAERYRDIKGSPFWEEKEITAKEPSNSITS